METRPARIALAALRQAGAFDPDVLDALSRVVVGPELTLASSA